jgi:hypothetical protein
MKYLLLLIALGTVACDKHFDSDWGNEKRAYANKCMTEECNQPIVIGSDRWFTPKSMKQIYIDCAKEFDRLNGAKK